MVKRSVILSHLNRNKQTKQNIQGNQPANKTKTHIPSKPLDLADDYCCTTVGRRELIYIVYIVFLNSYVPILSNSLQFNRNSYLRKTHDS